MKGEIILRAFKLEDLAMVDPLSSLVGKEDMLQSYNSIFTFERGGVPIACAGLVQLWAGVAEAWTVLGPFAKEHPLWVVKVLRKEMRTQIERMNLRRVQMHVEDTPMLLKWGRLLGFHVEGTMVNYTPEGKTLHILAFLPGS